MGQIQTQTPAAIKITYGFFSQEFNEKGELISQKFIAGDQVEFEDSEGNPIDDFDVEGVTDFYHPFEK